MPMQSGVTHQYYSMSSGLEGERGNEGLLKYRNTWLRCFPTPLVCCEQHRWFL